MAAFGGNTEGVLAAFTLEFLGPRRQREYGKIRCFTSIGWGLSSTIIGVVDDHFGFVYNLYGYLSLGVAQLGMQMLLLPRRTRAEIERACDPKQAARWSDLCGALCQWRMWLFLVEFLSLSFGVGVVERLIFAYVQHELGARSTLCGLGVP